MPLDSIRIAVRSLSKQRSFTSVVRSVYATARRVGGVVWTQDEDFDDLHDV